MTTQDLLELKSHFSFGENWSQYAVMIDQARIEQAEESLLRLVGREAIQGHTFLDIGCGSGLFSLAAVRLGCKQLLAVDLDPKSVETTRRTLSQHAPNGNWDCRNISVFDLDPAALGTFETVYSWGVLHHTGAMYKAIAKAATMVAPNGIDPHKFHRPRRRSGVVFTIGFFGSLKPWHGIGVLLDAFTRVLADRRTILRVRAAALRPSHSVSRRTWLATDSCRRAWASRNSSRRSANSS